MKYEYFFIRPTSTRQMNTTRVRSIQFTQCASGRWIAAYIGWTHCCVPSTTLKTNFRSTRMKKYIMLLAVAILAITSISLALSRDDEDPLKEGEKMAEKS